MRRGWIKGRRWYVWYVVGGGWGTVKWKGRGVVGKATDRRPEGETSVIMWQSGARTFVRKLGLAL